MSWIFPARWLQVVAVAGAIAGLAGCTVGPNYVRPAVDVPAQYAEARDVAPVQPAIAPRWWGIYDDPVLDALVSHVAVDNQSLKAAAARAAEARALLAAARGPRVPAVEVGTFNVGRRNRKDFGLALTWEVDLWGRIRRNVEAHGAAATASADDLAAATLSMQAEFVQSYFALREKDTLIRSVQQAAAVDAQAVKIVDNQRTAGVASQHAVTTAHARLAATQAQLAADRVARAQLEHALAVMLGKPPADFSLAPAPFGPAVPVIPAGLPSTLLQRRPDVAAAERRVAAASAEIGVREAERLPSLNLAAGVGVLHGLFATPTVKAPIYEGGALKANVAHARAAYDEAVANYRQTVLDAFREVEDNLAAQKELAGAAASRTAAVREAQASARSLRNQYRAGVASYADMANAEASALDNEQAGLELRLQRIDASVNLVKALGGGWVQPTQPEAAPAAASSAAAAPHAASKGAR